jgi:hypothetical protein
MTRARNLGDIAGIPYISAVNGNIGIGTTNPTSTLYIAGEITATSYSGDGSNLTGVAASTSLTIGRRTTAYQINIVGTGITISLRSGFGTINF